jgi:hypothetical protein
MQVDAHPARSVRHGRSSSLMAGRAAAIRAVLTTAVRDGGPTTCCSRADHLLLELVLEPARGRALHDIKSSMLGQVLAQA